MNTLASIVVVFLVIGIPFMIFIGSPFALWFQCIVSGAQIGFLNIVFMRFRKTPANLIIGAHITSVKAGIPLSTDSLEAHYLAGGNVMNVVQALVAADKAAIKLSFERATAIDLAGRDILEAVRTAVNPLVAETPSLTAQTKDGKTANFTAQVTMRCNIERLVGGAGKDTVLAKVGESLVGIVSNLENHRELAEHPEKISREAMSKGDDSGTAMEILCIEIIRVECAI